jgi:hypothetical protein
MSESVKGRLEKLEAIVSDDGKRCTHCNRMMDDDAERARLNAAFDAQHPFDWETYVNLFDDDKPAQAADELEGGLR